MLDNSAGNFDFGWLGQHLRSFESEAGVATIEMGARPYVPNLGRFASVDPIEGGSANDYDYTNQDPLNSTDIDGQFPQVIMAIIALAGVAGPYVVTVTALIGKAARGARGPRTIVIHCRRIRIRKRGSYSVSSSRGYYWQRTHRWGRGHWTDRALRAGLDPLEWRTGAKGGGPPARWRPAAPFYPVPMW
jgi:RHS repeat-associated protein